MICCSRSSLHRCASLQTLNFRASEAVQHHSIVQAFDSKVSSQLIVRPEELSELNSLVKERAHQRSAHCVRHLNEWPRESPSHPGSKSNLAIYCTSRSPGKQCFALFICLNCLGFVFVTLLNLKRLKYKTKNRKNRSERTADACRTLLMADGVRFSNC